MYIIKYTILSILTATLLVGGIAQLITLNMTVLQYNAYIQLLIGFVLFIYLCHKAISLTEVKYNKTPTNARDSKPVHKS